MPPAPRKRLVVVTCMDTRIDVHRLLELERGDAHVLRNAGGVVTEDVIRSVTVSQKLLGTNEVVVLMHTDCGMQGLSEHGGFPDLEEELREGLARLRDAVPEPDHVRGLVYEVDAEVVRPAEEGGSTGRDA